MSSHSTPESYTQYKALGIGFFTILMGGQFMYMYSLSKRSNSIQYQKEKLQNKKQKLA